MIKEKTRKLVKGVDFDGWGWKWGKPRRDQGDGPEGTIEAELYEQRCRFYDSGRPGKFVRVKLTEVGR